MDFVRLKEFKIRLAKNAAVRDTSRQGLQNGFQ